MVTAAVERAQAGIREVQFATAEANFAQAGKITQLEASLGNYYQDGTPGRALLEEQMTVTADKIAGLSSQWTMKVQAGKYVAGIGLAATENPDGSGTSALIIAAEKFAIVNPATYTTGLTNTPDPAHIPFGVDANGIYLNHNVYVRGNMRIDTGGKTLADGLRGSLMANAAGSWSDTAARNAIWTKLGKSGSAPNNNHLVIGDMVTMGNVTRYWNGSAWAAPGVVLNGDMLVDGSIAAQKINTNGLDIRDAWGNVIFSAGVNLNMSRVAGLGALASRDTAEITNSAATSTVTVNGVRLRTTDFVHALSKINSSNISTFMESAAIGNAYIGNAAVDTLNIKGNAVTVPVGRTAGNVTIVGGNGTPGYTALIFDEYIDLGVQSTDSALLGTCSFFMRSTDDAMGLVAYYINGAGPYGQMEFGLRVAGGGDTDMNMPISLSFIRAGLSGNVRVSVRVTSIPNSAGGYHKFEVRNPTLMLFGGKR